MLLNTWPLVERDLFYILSPIFSLSNKDLVERAFLEVNHIAGFSISALAVRSLAPKRASGASAYGYKQAARQNGVLSVRSLRPPENATMPIWFHSKGMMLMDCFA